MMLAHSLLAKRKSGTVVGSSGKGKLLDDTNKPQQLSRSISVNELNMSGSKNASAMNVSRSRHASISMKQGGPSFHCNGEDDQFDHNPATAHDERTEQEYTDSQLHDIDEVVAFLRKRAAIEEEYGRSMIKLSQSILGGKADDGKTGTYAEAWKHTLNLHENIGDIRLKFASSISAIADEVSTLHKNTERSRKQLKEAGYKHWKAVHESENCLEKSKKKYEGCSEDWEHALLIRETVSEGISSLMMPPSRQGGLAKSLSTMQLWKQATITKNPEKVQKQEEDARTRAAIANENYKQQLATTNTLRSNYFQIHLPRFIRMLLQTNETCDHGLQLQLIKHAHDMESMLLAEATLLSPVESDKLESGIVRTLEKIDNSSDFHQYMAAYFHNCKYFQKCDHQYSPYSMSPEAFSLANPKPVFGVDLSEVTVRDNIQVPLVVQKCIAAVEKDGLRIPGLYRVSAANHAVQKLRSQFNKDSELVDLGEWEDDISVVSSALKLYFRELPDSLFPKSMYHAFIDAARQSDECNRLISIHELVNQLNDAHYSTLQVLIGHLHNVQQLEAENRMGVQNLAIVWGPTLLDSPHDPMVAGGFDPSELRLQSKVVETILANYGRIFEL
ncbi:hypothetical protein HDU82_001313 [Entophlyctis luteolus]|nr:hypothetical protein HDU82_001313 [Entophlyctis luteolus]